MTRKGRGTHQGTPRLLVIARNFGASPFLARFRTMREVRYKDELPAEMTVMMMMTFMTSAPALIPA